MKKSLIVCLVLLALITASCYKMTKEDYLLRYKQFVDKVQKEYKNYSDKDWFKADKYYNNLNSTLYSKFDSQLTIKDRFLIKTYQVRYNYYRGSKEFENTLHDINDYLNNELKDDIHKLRKDIDSFTNEVGELFLQGKENLLNIRDDLNNNYLKNNENEYSSIISAKPNIEKIKNDLNRRELREQPNGYFSQDRRWLIEKDKIVDLKLLNEYSYGSDYFYEAYLIFRMEYACYEAYIDLVYIQGKKEGWTLSNLISKELRIINSGRYDNYIKISREGWSGEYSLIFNNYSDVSLIVGGEIYLEFDNVWRKFSTLVEGNGKKSIGGLFIGSIIDYNIHFIERP